MKEVVTLLNAGPVAPRMRHLHRDAETLSQDDAGLQRMRKCLDAAFPPAGARAHPVASICAAPKTRAEPDLTEISFDPTIPARGQERREERRDKLSVYRTAILRGQGGEALCLIRNISSGGLMGKLAATLAPGDPISVEIRSGSLINAHVVWTGDGTVGLAFDAPINVLEVLQAPASGDAGLPQRMPRIRVVCAASLVVEGVRQQTTLVDISQGGAKLVTDLLRQDEMITVTVRGLDPRRAIVRWARNGCAGIAFLNPIAFDTLACWAAERQREH